MCACPFSLDHNQIAHDYGMYYLTDYRKRGLIANKFLRYGLFSAKFYTKQPFLAQNILLSFLCLMVKFEPLVLPLW